jgi:membrane-bound lytic murein transglycosylase D
MKPALRNSLFIGLGVIIGVSFVATMASSSSSKATNLEGLENKEVAKNQQAALVQSKIMSFDIPANAEFAGEIVPVQNIEVKEALDKELLTNAYWQSNMIFYIKRAYRWFPIIEPILKENNIPDDFKYLAVIESGLLNATSPSGAKGFWQFMKATATDYDLEVNEFVDERNNLVKSTKAACKYLKSAYDLYNNWTLAAASYNMGKTGLLNALQDQRVNNYYDLLLNAETARYVYRIIAVKYIISNPNEYGFAISEVHLYPTYKTKSIEVVQSIEDLVDFAKEHKTNYKTIKLLNPWLIGKSLPIKGNKAYQILIPEPNSGLEVISETENKKENGN